MSQSDFLRHINQDDLANDKECSGPAFPAPGYEGQSLRAHAAIQLRVPDSGIDWLDEMIKKSNRNEAITSMAAALASNSKLSLGNGEVAALAAKYADAIISKQNK